MHGQTHNGSLDEEDYQAAVERAGVIELPDTAPPEDQFKNSDPSGVLR